VKPAPIAFRPSRFIHPQEKATAGPDKDRLEQIPTALRASPDDVAALRRFVQQTVRADPQRQLLLHELQPQAPISASTTGTHDD
jgi:hypothetical protein